MCMILSESCHKPLKKGCIYLESTGIRKYLEKRKGILSMSPFHLAASCSTVGGLFNLSRFKFWVTDSAG